MQETIKGKSPDTNPLGVDPISKLLMRFALPSIISMVVNSLYNIVDQIFIGQGVGYLGNAATNVIFPITVVTFAFSMLIGDGSAAFFSLSLGKRDYEIARKGVGNALVAEAVIAMFFTLIGLIFIEPLLIFFGATPDVLPYAIEYGRIIIAGIPFTVITIALSAIIRADGSPRRSMASMLTGAIFNIVFDPILILGFDMGVTGAAIATVAGQLASFVMMIVYIPKFKTIKITKDCFIPDMKLILKIASLGVSSFISQLAQSVVITVFNISIVNYGAASIYGPDIPMAVFGIVMKVSGIFSSVMMGIGIGSQPIFGFNYGAGNYERVRKAYIMSSLIATVVATLGFLSFELIPQQIINIFGSEDALYNQFGVRCFRINQMMFWIVGWMMVTGVYFQATGKPIRATVISISRQVGFLIPCLLILPIYFGIDGLLWSAPVSDALSVVLTVPFIIHEMKYLKKMMKSSEALPEA